MDSRIGSTGFQDRLNWAPRQVVLGSRTIGLDSGQLVLGSRPIRLDFRTESTVLGSRTDRTGFQKR